MLRQIILDTETTGLEPEKGHRVIEVGCLELINRKITGSTFHCYINPGRPVERDAREVHGITDDFLKDKPTFAQVVDELVDYIRDAELIIHNAPFDVGFLDHEFGWARKKFKVTDICTVMDTLTLARKKHPGQQNSLDALCRRYTVDNSNRDLHGALLDAELLAQVYLLMTGGQTQLFGGAQEEQQADQAAKQVGEEKAKINQNRQPLPIIDPSSEESAAHQSFLEMMREQGDCIWP